MRKLILLFTMFISSFAFAQETNEQEIDTLGTFVSLDEVVVASGIIKIAKERETPIALSTVTAKQILQRVGNQEFPEIMNNTPGVYATKQGGGYGDSRISVRGFTQRNTAFLINGQPVNDMENGWVYWSNWQGLTDVASGIQIQRGLGATSLAVPSVGGTVSIFTKAADKEEGGTVSQLIGNDNYRKTTVAYNTGRNDRGWATSLLLSKWAGDGYVNSTQGEGWTYFASVGYNPMGSDHSFNFSVLGAGQWHHQRDVWVSIRDYENFGDAGIDQRWNSNGGTLNGEEYSMRRNFYNKPLATFNWDWEISSNVKLATSLYGSAGRGGGTGPRGRNYDVLPYRQDLTEFFIEDQKTDFRFADGTVNYDAIVADNIAGATPYTGANSNYEGYLIGSNGYREDGVFRSGMIRRASMNSHNWIGGIMNLEVDSGNFKYSLGVDLRDYTGYHYRAVNDLLGFDAYYSTGNKNSLGQIITEGIEASPFQNTGLTGNKIDYYNIGNVGWQGLNALVEYSNDNNLTAVVQAGFSNQSYQREDLFDQPNLPISEKVNLGGGYLKGGANYNINENNNIFFNAGYIERQPNFDAVFPNYANVVNEELQNEKITSFELGYGFVSNSLKVNVNLYSTTWGDRFISRGFTTAEGADGTAQFRNIDQTHNGIEIEGSYKPSSALTIKGMVSVGDWKYTKNFNAALYDDNNSLIGEATLYTEDAKIGDAAQFVSYLEADYRVFENFSVDLGWRSVDNLYADYSIRDSAFLSPDNEGAIQLPAYNLVDFGASYVFDFLGNQMSARLNINNLFNEEYIAESNSNIYAGADSTTYKGIDVRNYVWFGFGTTWNFALRYNF